MMPTVVIPAYNEEKGIARCLRSVLADGVEDLVVVVVPNACRDATADRAREVAAPAGAKVLVVETAEGGKTNAINLGERALREAGFDRFPRLFLDGDIELAPGSLRALFARAAVDAPTVCAATPDFDASRSTVPVRCYYAADRFNPYHLRSAPNGSGTYCVNAAGRARWSDFPPIIADDSFVERQFAPAERHTVAGARARVFVPRSLAALRRISARKRLGAYELERYAPARTDDLSSGGTFRTVFLACARRPWLLPAFAVWASVKVVERLESRAVSRKSGQDRWQHDTSSRE
jgi:glycosyltransferase involved in cell wall biosynthesis